MRSSVLSFGRALKRDGIAQAALVMVVVGGLAERLAPAEQTVVWRHGVTMILLVLVLVGIRRGLGTVDHAERRFWGDLTFAHGLWLGAEVLQQVHVGWLSASQSLTTEIAFALFYVFFLLAAFRRSGSNEPLYARPLRTEIPALIIFIVGLLLYGALPLFGPPRNMTLSSVSLYLYPLLDGILIARFLLLGECTGSAKLQWIYRLMASACLCFAIADTLALVAISTNGFYALALWLIVLASGAKTYDSGSVSTVGPEAEPSRATWVYACLFPVLHIVAYRLGFLDPADEARRELFVLLWTLLLGAVALLQHHWAKRR